MRTDVVVAGAGIGGLVAALDLAVRGLDVVVVERAADPGGKMREVSIDNQRLDAGPTVVTMPWIFEEIFRDAGSDLHQQLTMRPLQVLARHAWSERESLDLFADVDRSAVAIEAFAGRRDADGYRDFCARAKRVYDALERPFMRASRPGVLQLMHRSGFAGLSAMLKTSPFTTLWRALGDHFRDQRLRQLFARYATYCGSSPYLAPATLMLIAHVEQRGVWSIDGGMQRLAAALTALAAARGVRFRFATEVAEVVVRNAHAAGVRLAGGESIDAGTVLWNGDPAALAAGNLGTAARAAVAPTDWSQRSLSAMTWNIVARTSGFPLLRHNVFFSADYAAEFSQLLRHQQLPQNPTVYVCAQDRQDTPDPVPNNEERLLCLVNAPARGDGVAFGSREIQQCENTTFEFLERCGLCIQRRPESTLLTTPYEFNRRFPATGGALYGRSVHGWRASFQRPGSRSKLPGLYLTGGGTHPGAGVPMVALSGRSAAASIAADLALTNRSRRAGMLGGMSMR